MKNISLILNAILIVAVGYLYYAHFKGTKTSAPVAIAPPSGVAGVKIAYVNYDTLNEKYEWLKEQRQALEQRTRNAENSLANRQQALMKEAAELEQRFRSGTMTQADAEKQQASLMQRGQRLQEEEARLAKSLAEEQKKALETIYMNLENNLKTLSSQIGYDYILSYTRGGQVLLANDSLDITKQVLQLLNAKKEGDK